MVSKPLRTACASLALLAFGCAGAPGGVSPGAPVATVTLAPGQRVSIAKESLDVEYTRFEDSRCPAGATCVWAGHAAVTLRVARAGSAPQVLTIGTAAAPAMNLPYDADYEQYVFHLVQLEPASPRRATVSISRR